MGLREELLSQQAVMVAQRHELAELVGFETRNKYQVQTEDGRAIGFAAEQQKGVLGFLARQFLGHWRLFDLLVFDNDRKQVLTAHHPFRWIFQRLEIRTADGGPIGAIQQRFSILYKKFDVEDPSGRVLMQVASPFWRIWTFPFEKNGRGAATVTKRWSGMLAEAFTDKDKFRVEFNDPGLGAEERLLVLAAAIFIDLQYFEAKAGS